MRALSSYAKKAGYVLAACIILAAIFISVIHTITPILDEHRADLESYASQLLQSPVTIKSVRLSWYRYQPVIGLNNVDILNKESKVAAVKIKKVNILFSLPRSLWERKLVMSGIVVSGSNLTVQQSATGEFNVPGLVLPEQPTTTSENKLLGGLAWLSQQPHLILHNIDVHYEKFNGPKNFVTIQELNFENAGENHKAQGKATLHQTIPTEVNFLAQWKGSEADLKKTSGSLYLYVSGFSFSQWMKEWKWKDWQINEGIASAKVWASWEKGVFERVQSTFQLFNLELFSLQDKTKHTINRVSGNIGWKQQGETQIIAGEDILIDLPNHLWPVTHFNVSLAPTNQSVYVSYADLNDIQSFLYSSNLVTDSTKKLLKELQIKGVLQDTSLAFINNWQNTEFATHFSELAVSSWKKYPGVKNLNGSINWKNAQGDLQLNSKKMTVEYRSIANHQLLIDQLSGNIHFQQEPNQWLLQIGSLHFMNHDAAANLSGKIAIPNDASAIVDLNANMTLQKAENVTRYLPSEIFDKDLVEWLKQAFLSGEVRDGHMILRGDLKDFPFDQKASSPHPGEFSITTKVNNIDLRFAPDWPVLRHITGSLAFLGRQIVIDIDHAETNDIPLTKVHAIIPYIGDAKPQILEIQTLEEPTDFMQAMKYVHASPLEKNIGKMFHGVELSGPITLQLQLNIPLSRPDDTQVNGNIKMLNGVMNLAEWNLRVDDLQGDVQFTEDTVQGKAINAELFHKPLQFDLRTQKKAKNLSIVKADFVNNVSVDDLANWLHVPFNDVVQGSANVKGSIDFSLTQPFVVHLNSDLVGMKVNLIEPYGKNAATSRNFVGDIILQNEKPMRLKLGYANLLNAAIVLDRKQDKYQLISAGLGFGSDKVDWPTTPGLFLSGKFKELDWDKIKTYLNSTSSKSTAFTLPDFKELDVSVNALKLGNQALTQLRLQASVTKDAWDVTVHSNEVVGDFIIPINFNRQSTISGQLQKVNINLPADKKNKTLLVDVKSLPALSLSARSVTYNDMSLGAITFKATPVTNGLNIQKLQITSPLMNLQATGDWTQSGKNIKTRLQGNLSSSHVSRLLNHFGLNAHNFIANTGNLNFDLNWNDAPYAASLPNLSGTASLNLDAGRIVDIGDQAGAKMGIGRMLSIFSLQTIPRRLSLDFSDIFAKGYSFDSLRGDFSIQNGDVYTRNMRFDGPVAQVKINGRIGLSDKDFDFVLTIVAHVTSSIPVAATLLTGNPLIGLGALAVNSVIGSKVSTIYYAVTGTWDNPVWKPIDSGKNK